MANIPQSVAELTPAWLTTALAPLIGSGRVSSVTSDDIGTGVGVFGIIARLHLTYEGAPATAPTTLIAKMPTDAEANRTVGMALGLYARENNFYDNVADSVPFPVPTCHVSQTDAASGHFLLIMEDLGHLEAGDQLAGITVARAEAIIDALAAFHATWWESPELDTLDWLPTQDAPIYFAAVPAIVSAGLAALPPLAAELPAGSLELATRVDANFVSLIHKCAAGPRTFIHGDARLDNLFFAPDTNEFTLIDWQLSLRCRGIYDVVWLLATSMDIEVQNEHADDLLVRYHDALARNGVSWPMPALRVAAAEQSAYLLSGPLSLIGTFDFSEAGDGRAAQLTRKWVARGFNLALLYGAGDVL
jgi:Phosphotransferase enzyme family